MRNITLFLFFVFLFAFILTSEVSAQVVINEFSSSTLNDWVEVYNSGDSSVDLSTYILRDSTSSNKKELVGILDPGNISVFEFSRYLNKDGDIVKLLLISGGEELSKDSISYGDKGGICIPSESGSVGRLPNGSSSIVRFLTNTKNSLNESGNDDPCPTSTPVPTEVPTSEPDSTSTPVPTEAPTLAPTARVAATKRPTMTPRSVGKRDEDDDSEEVLGLRGDLMASPSPELEEGVKKKFPFMAGLFLVGGIGLIGVAGFTFFKNKKKEYNKDSKKKRNDGFNKIKIKGDDSKKSS